MGNLLCAGLGIISIVWIFMSDVRRMVVPAVPLVLLAGAGTAWRLQYGTWADILCSAIVILPFSFLYFKKGLGEGDLFMMFALSPWFHYQVFLVVLFSGFVIGAAWGGIRLIRANELKGWLCRVIAGAIDEIPEHSEEALTKAECVPLAAALSLPALVALTVPAFVSLVTRFAG